MADTDFDMDDGGDDMPTAPFWMTTFSDMVTLLLTFFVLIVSMSTVEIRKFTEALSYFQGRSGVLLSEAVMEPNTRQVINDFRSREQSERYEELLRFLREQGLEDKVRVYLTDKGLQVTITDSVMFESGSAVLIDPSRTVLRKIRGVLGSDVESVVVDGHTDNRPIRTSSYPSNWEHSTARASSVVRFLLEEETLLPPERYSAVGYGEFHP
ncbi:MAG: OmpA/MotB family protein, partial [Bacteroidota bacterium]